MTVGDGNDLYRRDSAQPTLPNTHRRFANPAPLGMFGFATSLMLISFFGVGARGATTPNIIVGPLIFFGGIGQYISGIMEFVSGNTVSMPPLTMPHFACGLTAFSYGGMGDSSATPSFSLLVLSKFRTA